MSEIYIKDGPTPTGLIAGLGSCPYFVPSSGPLPGGRAYHVGCPTPTYFHPAKDADVFSWQDRMRKLDRRWLFSFAGAPRPRNPESIRGQIIDQCKAPGVCRLLECDLGESACRSPSNITHMFQSSLFCLQPHGDSYTIEEISF
uniref:Exostosin GT47 domain-containing protein n=1 Tax=Ananas comosus var. bracteatus TaxID=296719 RepID=A0A6V7QLD1_ANACO|nr:unnamed protein product [Ananas comosus var. bracteatus]